MTEIIKTSTGNEPVETKMQAVNLGQEKAGDSVNRQPNWMKFLLPGSIVLAAVLISGTLLYVKVSGGLTNNAEAKQILTEENLKKWAKKLKLNTKEFNACLDSKKYEDEVAKDIADGQASGVEGTPTFFINGRSLIGAVPFEQFQTAIEQSFNMKPLTTSKTPTIDDDPVIGSEEAPVTIIMFSDFECPYCRSWWQDTFPLIKSEYIDLGKVRLVHRDFPLSFHTGATPAALATECANEQGKFWEMADKIFSEQDKAAQ